MPTSVEHQVPPARFAARAVTGLVLLLAAALGFVVLLALVASRWAPLHTVDAAVVDTVTTWMSGRPAALSVAHVLTDLGGSEVAWLLLPTATAWLLLRRAPHVAFYVAVTGLGLLVLSWGTKELVSRVRPVVDVPLASAPGHSFPSGHAMGSTVTYGVLLLVFLPAVPARFRRAVTIAAVTLVAVVGMTRVALGVHYPSDVVAGWLFGVLWLAVTTTAFRRSGPDGGRRRSAIEEGLAPETKAAVEPAPAHDAPLPHGWHGAATLLVAAVLLWGGLVGLGLLVTDVFTTLDDAELAVLRWFASIRTQALTSIAVAVGMLGGTTGILAALVVAVPLALAATRRWTPAVFLVLCSAGETALFLATAAVVGRSRPGVDKLSPQLPPTSSFPSGHVAAALVTWGAIALLVVAWSRSRWRYAAVVLAALVVLGVALSRLYRGVHYPTDVLASVLYASVWLAVCWHVLQPARGAPASRDR